ncbi:MAG: hypothetical protein HY785_17450 [Oscillatoriophycideae cyanobacterium NC_groundwater_1537_Pr4_S-0.65um_50_18]|nr:hypothetical protein [Oscillatoriophycideae cyanobacterium NC_groundwater_1537_Pr4_S-0.65um_50_18]
MIRVNKTIEDVLDDYPVHPYHAAFSMPELRQKLIAHIISQIFPRHGSETVQESSDFAQVWQCSRLQAQLRMDMLVRGSILHMLRENATWLSQQLPNL